jgi:hypothetical protein
MWGQGVELIGKAKGTVEQGSAMLGYGGAGQGMVERRAAKNGNGKAKSRYVGHVWQWRCEDVSRVERQRRSWLEKSKAQHRIGKVG